MRKARFKRPDPPPQTGSRARERLLDKIRTALGGATVDELRSAVVKDRLRLHPANLVPARANLPGEQLIALFRQMLESQAATVIEVETPRDVPAAVADYLRRSNLPARVRMGQDALLRRMPWQQESAVECLDGAAEAGDAVGISHATAAAAETGTLFLASGKDNPVTLNFLPDTHIVVVEQSKIAGSYEAVWGRVRASVGNGPLPRTINLISGPSRTADIEQTIVMGAHGPRSLAVVIIRQK
ncbi:MAG: LUD domain-containing protein [Hyphomicrobiaceae bacterium]|nr:LUD domain-containing protein [Hyphomicrobiaceae bacterium]